jgi:hypothetical protein
VILDVGRSVITLPTFWEAPFAYALLETPLPLDAERCSASLATPSSMLFVLALEGAVDPTTFMNCSCLSFSCCVSFGALAES